MEKMKTYRVQEIEQLSGYRRVVLVPVDGIGPTVELRSERSSDLARYTINAEFEIGLPE